jgi:hypothetical protein
VNNVEDYLRTHGDSGKEELNSVGSAHTITMVASTTVKYSGCDFESGTLRLLFNPGELGCNIDDAFSKLAAAVNDAPRESVPALSFAVRHNISKTYTPQIADVLAEAAKILENPDLKFEPDFEGIYKGLKNGGSDVRSDWEANLGEFTVLYFKGFLYTINRDNFSSDEMLREGLAEAIPAGVIKLRVVDKLSSGYNEILIEDDALVIQVSFRPFRKSKTLENIAKRNQLQTTPDNWGVNIDDATSKLIDLL